MQEPRLTPTSYIVLGLLELAGEATPYALKQLVRDSVGNFWSLQHAQLYTEPERLTKAGYLRERREPEGRRRRRYSLTPRGREALRRWRSEPTSELYELRDPGLLQLFFGADPAALARVQIALHRDKLEQFEKLLESDPGTGDRGPWLTLEAGVRVEREIIRFWEAVSDPTAPSSPPRNTDGRRRRRSPGRRS
jgi:PadR family transcriptional regulator, regulatory protein AphA